LRRSASAVSVTSANAATQGVGYVQADVQSIATLANELKGDVNTLVTDVNALITIQADRTLTNEVKSDLNSHITEFNTLVALVNELKATVNDITAALNE
jgi:uncharacterized protein YoxC